MNRNNGWSRGPIALGLIGSMALSMTTVAATAGTTIAYWPFGESGLNDASGNGHTLEGGATIDDHATLGGTAETVLKTVSTLDLSAYDDVTVEYFIKVKDHVSTANVLEHSASMNANIGGFEVLLNDRDPGDQRSSVLINAGGGIPCIDSAIGPFQNGAWHHVAIVIKSKSTAAYSASALSDYILAMYIDGAAVAYQGKRATLTGNKGPTTLRNATLFIGSRNNASLFMTGELDDIRVTAGALTPSEFLQSRTSRAAKTIAYYPFGSKGLADASGNGHHLHASSTGVTLGNDGAVALSEATDRFLMTYKPLDLRAYTDGLTIECWFKTTQADKRPILVHAPAWNLQYADKPIVVFAYNKDVRTFTRNTWDGTHNDDMTAVGNLNDGEWHRLAYVFDPTATDDTVKLYVDGTHAPQTTPALLRAISGFGNGFLSLGRSVAINAAKYTSFSSSGHFVGEIDDVRITDAALDPADFQTVRTTDAGEVTDPPVYGPYTLSHYKFARHAELKDEVALNPLTEESAGAVSFEEGAAVFSGLGALATRMPPDLSPYDKLTVEFFVNYPKLREGDIKFEMNFLQTGNALVKPGDFRLASDAGYKSSPARAGALLVTKSDKYKGDMYSSPQYGDGQWHHWVYRYDRTGESLVTDLSVDGVQVPHDSTAFTDVTKVVLRKDTPLYVGGRSSTVTNTSWKTSCNLYGKMDDIRISVGCLAAEQQLSERSVDPAQDSQPIATWDFASDTPAKDASGTYTMQVKQGEGAPVFEDGKIVFSGAAGASIGNPYLSYATKKAVTVETVFRADAPYEKTEMLFEMGDQYTEFGSTQFYGLLAANGDIRAGLYNNSRTIPGRFIRRGEWNHLALTIDLTASDPKQQVSLYVNGVQATEGVWSASISMLREAQPLRVGARNVTDLTFVGAMDGFAVTEGALGPGTFRLSRPAPADPETGVIAYWPFGHGNPCGDKSGHGHDFAPAGVVPSGDSSLKLAGAGVATLGYIPFNSATNGLTVECFMKADTAAGMTAATLFKTTSGVLSDTTGALGVELASGALVSKWESGMFTDGADNVWRRENADTTSGTAAVFADGQWHHVAVVVDPSVIGYDRAVLYVDGAKMASVTDADGDRDQEPVSGFVTVGEGFYGEIDDLRITARALAPAAFLQERTPRKGCCLIFR